MGLTLTFGKYNGQSIEDVFAIDPDYVQWLSDKSRNSVVRMAADKVLNAERRRVGETIRSLNSALDEILDKLDEEGLIPHLTDYQYEVKVSHHGTNETTISFEIGHFLDDEGWNLVEIRNALPREEQEEHYESWEDTPHPTQPVVKLPTPSSEAEQWYAFPDNLGKKPLNTTPVMLVEAVKLLEQLL